MENKQEAEKTVYATMCAEINPMQNVVILDNVFSQCSSKELKTLRLVNKLWYTISLPYWREMARPLKLAYNRNNSMCLIKIMNLNNFLESIEGSSLSLNTGPMYSKFKILNWKFNDGSNMQSTFWNKCGSWITYLEITFGTSNGIQGIRDVVCGKFTPNLKHLVVSIGWQVKLCVDESCTSLPSEIDWKPNLGMRTLTFSSSDCIRWIDIFRQYPRLQNLSVQCPYEELEYEQEISCILRQIAKIRNNDKKDLALKAFSIDSYAKTFSHNLSQLLQKCNLPLESISIDLGKDTSQQTIYDILCMHKRTMKKLDIFQHNTSPVFNYSLFGSQLLGSIQYLKIHVKSCQNMGFLKFTSILKGLHVYTEDSWVTRHYTTVYRSPNLVELTDDDDMNNVVLLHLKSFKYECKFSVIDMKKMVRWMPNVETFTASLTNDTFRIVCANWGNMTNLTVTNGDVGDEGITGISTSDLKIQPNLTCLKNLRRLTIHNRFSIGTKVSKKLTDKSVYLGLLKTPKLEKLRIAALQEFSHEAKAALKTKVGDFEFMVVV